MTDFSVKIKGFIFNLDGVIVDTAKYHYKAWLKLADEMGVEFPPEQHEQLRSLSRMESLEKILEWGGLYMTEAEKLHWADVKNNWYQGLIANMTPDEVFPGVLSFLDEVRQYGGKTALSSASRNARTVLESTQIDTCFDVVLDGAAARKPKPHPDCFLMAASALGLAPAECIVFDDAVLGVQAARDGGFHIVGVGKPDDLPDAELVIPGFDGLSLSEVMEMMRLIPLSMVAS
ncbi:MAG: beta-phosphoglucomutase [Saprospiraceae bacterium]|nr:beta-phosphoglucomutase [Saprospiraceae bacterium]